MLYVGVGKGAQSLDKSWKIHVNSPFLFSLPTRAPSPPRSNCLSFPLMPSAPAHTLASWCYIIIPQALSQKGENASRKRDICQVSSRAISPCSVLLIALSLSLSLDPLPLYLTVILSTSHCALPFLLEPCEIDQCRGGVGGLLVQLDGGFDIFKAKNKLRLGTDLLTCTWLLGPYYHPETNIQLPKIRRYWQPSLIRAFHFHLNWWPHKSCLPAFQNLKCSTSIGNKTQDLCLFWSIYMWLSLKCLRF